MSLTQFQIPRRPCPDPCTDSVLWITGSVHGSGHGRRGLGNPVVITSLCAWYSRPDEDDGAGNTHTKYKEGTTLALFLLFRCVVPLFFTKMLSSTRLSLVFLLASAIVEVAAWARIPVVGILAQPLHDDDSTHDYIASSYMKWCEAGGATTIAIPYNSSDVTVYDALLDQMDGLLLPGGAAPLSAGVVYLLDRIRHFNTKRGRYFPVWGTCLGFEFLIQYMLDDTLETGFVASNVSWPLEQVERRELYADQQIYMAVSQQNLTLNNHVQGIRPEIFAADTVLPNYWHVTSINHDERGVPFVSTIEPVDQDTFPFYGVQYHPEKNAFEYGINKDGQPYEAINHSPAAVNFSMRLAAFWIGKVRRAADQRALPKCGKYCVPPLYSFPIQVGQAFEQVHLIPKDYPVSSTTSVATD
eukprot:scaffold37822_cov168-Amphora_coffeaeformis.AAC.1